MPEIKENRETELTHPRDIVKVASATFFVKNEPHFIVTQEVTYKNTKTKGAYNNWRRLRMNHSSVRVTMMIMSNIK
jgi:hypothetical protein